MSGFEGLRRLLSSIIKPRDGGACLFETPSQDKLFRQIAENIGDVIWMTDQTDDVFFYISPAYERVWGRTCRSLYQNPKIWVETIWEEDRARVLEAVRARETLATFDVKYRIVRPDGTQRWIHDRAFPIRDGEGRVYRYVGLARDITERHLDDQSARRLAAIVEASDDAIVGLTTECAISDWNHGAEGIYRDITGLKHEEENRILRERERVQREMIAVLSHDLRTPLAAIKGFAETLRTGGLDDARCRLSFVRVIERHADKLAKLVDNMLAQSNFEHGRRFAAPQAVGLEAFVSEHVSGLEPIVAKKQIDLSLDVEPLTILADPGELSQVFQNLLDNAIKFTARGGRIGVQVRLDGESAHVSVRDSGPGIPKEDLERIFDRFQRAAAHTHVKGTGLGLFIARKIVEAAGGQIWAESVPGCGSCFHFTLPLTERAPQAQAGVI